MRATKTERINMRIDPRLKDAAQQAADGRYQSLTDWIIQAIREKVDRNQPNSSEGPPNAL